jgi:cyclase
VSGGAGKYEDSYEAIVEGKASAVAMGSVFHFTEQTPLELKRYLSKKGILIRNTVIG